MKRFVISVVAGVASASLASLSLASNAVAQTDAPSSASKGASGESLSTKLNKSDGVITPQANVDPGIHVPAPDPHPNSTPVVPPSATGGGTAK